MTTDAIHAGAQLPTLPISETAIDRWHRRTVRVLVAILIVLCSYAWGDHVVTKVMNACSDNGERSCAVYIYENGGTPE